MKINLYIDIGNTHVSFGFTKTNKITDLKVKKIKTEIFKKSTKFESELSILIKSFKIDIDTVYLSSTVDHLSSSFKKYFKKHKINFIKMTSDIQNWLDLTKLYNQYEIGADVLAQTSYITHFFKEAIVVSFGTATVIYHVKDNVFNGCVILPGIYESAKNLVEKTDIKSVSLKLYPDRILGFNTNEAVSIGILNSVKVLVENMVSNLKTKCPIIYTGGKNYYFSEIEWWYIENLEILGLFIFSQKN